MSAPNFLVTPLFAALFRSLKSPVNDGSLVVYETSWVAYCECWCVDALSLLLRVGRRALEDKRREIRYSNHAHYICTLLSEFLLPPHLLPSFDYCTVRWISHSLFFSDILYPLISVKSRSYVM